MTSKTHAGAGMSLMQRSLPLGLLALLACAPVPRRKSSLPQPQPQQQPPAPRTDVAFLQARTKLDVYIHSIDGRSLHPAEGDRLEIPPGIHTFAVKFRKFRTPAGQPLPNATGFDLSINAKVGEVYQLEYTRSDTPTKWSACIVAGMEKRRVSSLITSDD
jgi:hypothetical protein